MRLLLLDTTFLIDAERGTDDLDNLIADEDDVAIAAITLAELTVGVQLATTRQRPRRQSYVNEIAASIPILPYDETVANHHATLLVAVRRAGPSALKQHAGSLAPSEALRAAITSGPANVVSAIGSADPSWPRTLKGLSK